MEQKLLGVANMRSFLAVIVIVSMIAYPVGAQGQTIYDVDESNPLNDKEAVQEFLDEGEVTRTVERYGLTITVSEKAEYIDHDTYKTDYNNVWVRFDYRESIPRTFRLYFTNVYWQPIPSNDLESENTKLTADLVPTKNRKFQSVTIDFKGQEDAVFAISVSAGRFWKWRQKGRSAIEQETNITIPSIATGKTEQWTYVEPSELSGANATNRLELSGDFTMQYQAGDDWLTVPKCENQAKIVCWFRKDGETNSTYVLSLRSDAPQVRYKQGNDPFERVQSSIRDILNIPDRIGRSLSGLFDFFM